MQPDETMVRVYKSNDAYQGEARKLAAQGWRVVGVTERRPRAGIGRILLLWFLVLIFPPKPELIVTYARTIGATGYDQKRPSDPETVACPRCQAATPLSARFCPECGLQRTQAPRY